MNQPPYPKKSLGQHWLHDQPTLNSICDAADLERTDTVLEIGPGTGMLTRELLIRARNVVAVELDADLADQLSSQQDSPRLDIITHDILRFDFGTLPPDYKVVANIPYYLTSKLIRVLSEATNRAMRVVLLVQKEVAERVAAQPGHMSLLSVSAQFYWKVSLGDVVPAELFVPPPKVDSRVLILSRPLQPLFPEADPKRYFRLVKAGFAGRRKTLLNSLAGGLRTDKEQIRQVLAKAGISDDLRAQALSLDEWFMLYSSCIKAEIL